MRKPALQDIARRALLCATAFAVVAAVNVARADGRPGKHIVVLPKTGERCANDPKCHNRWHPAIPPVAAADSGDTVVFGTRDAFDHSLDRNSTAADVVALNLNLVHPLTGPLYVRGAKAGDVLAVTLLDVAPDDFGYTIIVPGFGFLRDVFPDPFIARWDLTRRGATSPDLPGVKIRFDGFMGTIGVAPGPAEVETYFQRESELRSEEHTSELQSLRHLVCRLLLEKKKQERRSTLIEISRGGKLPYKRGSPAIAVKVKAHLA